MTSVVPASPAPERCRRCGGAHAARERCLLDSRSYMTSRGVRPYVEPDRRARPVRDALRIAATAVATVAVVVAVPVLIQQAFSLAERGTDASTAVLATAIAAAVAAISCWVLYLCMRAYAGALFTLLAIVLLTTGPGMIVAAFVVRQMNVPHLVEYRGFTALVWYGALVTAAGVLLATFCLHWSMRKGPRRRIARWGRLIGAAYGVLLTLGGLGITFALFTLAGGEETFDESGDPISVAEQAIGVTAFAAWWLVPGIVLTYQCISASMGEGSSAFRAPVMAAVLALYGGLLAIGQLNMMRETPLAAPMPVLHVLAASLPAIALVGLAARGSPLRGRHIFGLTWRQATLAAAVSMGVATLIASYIESIGGVYGVVAIMVSDGAFEFASNFDEVADIISEAEFRLTANQEFVAGLIVGAVLAPLSEELGKSLGVRFTMSPDSTRAHCFLLGGITGAAFGFLEALLYGYGAIAEELDYWWWIMLLRAGSTSGHVLWSGLAGLGWWYWTIGRKHRTALLLFGAAILGHALWNAAATAIDSRIFIFEELEDRTLLVIIVSVVVVESIGNLVAIPLISRAVRGRSGAPVEATELGAMQPWLAST